MPAGKAIPESAADVRQHSGEVGPQGALPSRIEGVRAQRRWRLVARETSTFDARPSASAIEFGERLLAQHEELNLLALCLT